MKPEQEKIIEAGGEDHAWLIAQNLAPYAGKWIAVSHKRVVASGPTLRVVLEKARAEGVEPVCLRVPKEYVTV